MATSVYPVSAAEALYHVTAQKARTADAISIQRRSYPKDSMRVIAANNARRWLALLGPPPGDGLQRDPYGAIAVIAGQELAAQRVIAACLATPGLSMEARAYTYFSAIRAFTTPDIPAHLPIAEQYLAQLEALDLQKTAYWQHMAHRGLVGAYYLLGRSADVVRHGTRAIELLAVMPYFHRRDTDFYDDAQTYAETIDALAGQPDGLHQIRTLNATLLAVWTPPVELAQDPEFLRFAAHARQEVSQMIMTGMRVGTHGDDIVGSQWVNAPPQTARLSVADGRVHVVALGHYSCPPCQQAMVALQRIQDRYPGIQVINVTATEGTWGFQLVSPDTEVKKLAAYYTTQLKIRYPITIWPGVLKLTSDGGMLPENDGPNFAHYPMAGKPNIYVIDGHGMIRRVFVGALTRERESQLAQLIDVLLHDRVSEAAQ